MENISSIAPKALKKQLVGRKPRVLEILVPVWPHVVGKLIAQHCQPAAFNQGTLTLSAFSPPWAAQLSHMTEQIQTGINRFLGAPAVRKLRVRCRPQEQITPPPTSHPEGESAPYPPEEVARLLWADGETSLEPELTVIVERSFAKYFSRNHGKADACH